MPVDFVSIGQINDVLIDYNPIDYYQNNYSKNKEVIILINFSYVLESYSLNEVDIKNISYQIFRDYIDNGNTVIIVNQNPNIDYLNKNWIFFKDFTINKYSEKNNFSHKTNCVQGVNSIKHFPSSSKVRYEILFFNDNK